MKTALKNPIGTGRLKRRQLFKKFWTHCFFLPFTALVSISIPSEGRAASFYFQNKLSRLDLDQPGFRSNKIIVIFFSKQLLAHKRYNAGPFISNWAETFTQEQITIKKGWNSPACEPCKAILIKLNLVLLF